MESCRKEQRSCHPNVIFSSPLRRVQVNDFLHLPDKRLTSAIRKLPNLLAAVASGGQSRQTGRAASLTREAYEHATTHSWSDAALNFVWIDLVCGSYWPCGL